MRSTKHTRRAPHRSFPQDLERMVTSDSFSGAPTTSGKDGRRDRTRGVPAILTPGG